MKVIIEIPNKYLDIAKSLSIAACKTEKDEEEIARYAEIAMKTKDVIEIDPHDLLEDDKETLTSAYLQFALFALAGISKQKES